MFRVRDLEDAEIWAIAARYIEPLAGRPARARAQLLARSVAALGLRLECDDTPPRHAVIVGWPEEKHRVMDLAAELARSAVLVQRTVPAE